MVQEDTLYKEHKLNKLEPLFLCKKLCSEINFHAHRNKNESIPNYIYVLLKAQQQATNI